MHALTAYVYPHAGPIRIAGATGDPDDVVLDGMEAGTTLYLGHAHQGAWLDAITMIRGGRPGTNDAMAVSGPFGLPCGFHITRSVFTENHDTSAAAIVDACGTDFLLEDSVLHDNSSTGSIAGLNVVTSLGAPNKITIRRSRFEHNTAVATGGFQCNTGNAYGPTLLQVEDTVFEGNSGRGMTCSITAKETVTTLERVDFIDNDSGSYDGAGLEYGLRDGRGRLALRDVRFLHNTAHAPASAMHLVQQWYAPTEPNYAVLERVTFYGNVDTTGPMRGLPPMGGALGAEDWVVSLRDVDFGSGADDNVPRDLEQCTAPLGAHTSGVVVYNRMDYCP